MKTLPFLIAATVALAGCATSAPGASAGDESAERFIMASPTYVIATEFSMRWLYSFVVAGDPRTVTEVRFSCDPIPGTTFSTRQSGLDIKRDGTFYARGPIMRVSMETTPWLLEDSLTTATCKATILRGEQPQTVISTTEHFNPRKKAWILDNLKTVHDGLKPTGK